MMCCEVFKRINFTFDNIKKDVIISIYIKKDVVNCFSKNF